VERHELARRVSVVRDELTLMNLPPAAGRLPFALVSALEGKGVRQLQRELASLRLQRELDEDGGGGGGAAPAAAVGAKVAKRPSCSERISERISAKATPKASKLGDAIVGSRIPAEGQTARPAKPPTAGAAKQPSRVLGRVASRKGWFAALKR
jgi:hypothetical protein